MFFTWNCSHICRTNTSVCFLETNLHLPAAIMIFFPPRIENKRVWRFLLFFIYCYRIWELLCFNDPLNNLHTDSALHEYVRRWTKPSKQCWLIFHYMAFSPFSLTFPMVFLGHKLIIFLILEKKEGHKETGLDLAMEK